jgi:hypothetical protein
MAWISKQCLTQPSVNRLRLTLHSEIEKKEQTVKKESMGTDFTDLFASGELRGLIRLRRIKKSRI